jgi:hypothetical protein
MKLVHNKIKFEAAFHAAKIDSILHKVCAVLGRQIGKNVKMGPLAIPFIKGGHHFHGIDAHLGGDVRIRFNLLYGEQVQIYSISYWLSYKETPDYEIDLNGFNIVQVIDTVAEVLKNHGALKESRRITEASAKRTLIMNWAQSQGSGVDSLHGSFNNKSVYDEYAAWSRENRLEIVTFSIFKYYLREYFESTGNHAAADVESVTVRAGQSENYAEDQPGVAASFENLAAQEAELEGMYALLGSLVKGIASSTGRVNSAFIYGSGGIGKTYNVKSLLKELGVWNRVYMTTGSIKGYTALAAMLYNHRKNKIIVLDDNDDILKEPRAINVLKGAMDFDDPRIISLESASIQRETIDLNRLGVPMDTNAGIVHTEPDDDGSTPDRFIFKSKIIFISNVTTIPQPISDRAMACEMNITKEQFFVLLRLRLNSLFADVTEVTIEDKERIFSFMQEHRRLIKNTTFRLFQKLTNLFLIVDRNEAAFTAQALRTIRSEIVT